MKFQNIFLLVLVSFSLAGCYTPLSYKADLLPRTPSGLHHVIKKGAVQLVVDEPLLGAERKQVSNSWKGGAQGIAFPAGQYIREIATAVLHDAVLNNSPSRDIQYTFRIKNVQYFYEYKDVKLSVTTRFSNLYSWANMDIEVTTQDGKVIMAETIHGEERNEVDKQQLEKMGPDAGLNMALIDALHNVVCKGIEALAKIEQTKN